MVAGVVWITAILPGGKCAAHAAGIDIADLPSVSAAVVSWVVGRSYAIALKRRDDTVALLLDHRLLFTAPAPTAVQGQISLSRVPSGVDVNEIRYHAVGPRLFGDDFMRPEGLERFMVGQSTWTEDDVWKTAFYRWDDPGNDPRDHATGHRHSAG